MTINLILNGLEALAAIIIPVAAINYIKIKFDGKLKNAFHGAVVFFIFYCLVFAVLSTCIEFMTPVYEKIKSDIWLVIMNVFVETSCVTVGYKIWYKGVIKAKDDNGVGLMTGGGFAFLRTIFAFFITSLLSVITGSLYLAGKLSEVSPFLESSFDAFVNTTPYYSFLLLVQLISVFVLETAFAFVIYRTKRCGDAGYWLFIAFILRIGAMTVLKSGNYIGIGKTAIVFIVVAVTLVVAGIGYSLVKPFVRKADEG